MPPENPIVDKEEKQDDGWIEWKGGKLPINPDKLVEVTYRWDKGGWPKVNHAGHFTWSHGWGLSDIIAYRNIV